ncbi:TetR family transcriptional regulator [Burkholderia sp. TSV86]|uniref:TetR family transcriptional regulator n=1 Tax=Burkholderia sp. TSV86 TaxID=1385594 RepID=UPI000A702FDA|nr:TetR family transcriptional regulator [Burkholderia sp. TSV86]
MPPPAQSSHMKQATNKAAAVETRANAHAAQTRRDDGRRKYDPEQTKRNILDVATEEFSAMGLAGARVDAIAERTNTTKRMLYYYFGSKEGLYEAVLEKVYGDIRALELELNVGELEPEEGLRRLVEFTFDYHDKHRDFVRLVSIENIHGAKYLEQIKSFKNSNVSIIKTLETLLAHGIENGAFRDDIDPIDLHLLISSFCFHRVSNRYTFGAAFGRDPSSPRQRSRHRAMIADSVLRFVAR